MPVDDESAPVLSGRTLPLVERRRGRRSRSRSVFRTYRPWRRRIEILAFVTAFGVVGAAFVATVSDIADEPPSSTHEDPLVPHNDQPLQEPHELLDPH